jgi:hypothetical protein
MAEHKAVVLPVLTGSEPFCGLGLPMVMKRGDGPLGQDHGVADWASGWPQLLVTGLLR